MSSQENCLFCLRNCKNAKWMSDATVGEESLIEIVKLHFSFQFKYEINDQCLCARCFLNVQNFHEFYLEVRNIQWNMQDGLIKNNSDVMIDEDTESERQSIKKESPIRNSVIVTEDLHIEIISNEPEVPNLREKRRKVKRSKKTKNGTNVDRIKNKKIDSQTKDGLEYKNKLLQTFSMKCDDCELNFTDWDEARIHYRSAHNKTGYLTCCDRRFFTYGRAIEHVIWHDNPDSYKCTICDKSFLDGYRLRKHTNEIHRGDELIFKCDKCPREYRRRSTLNFHVRTIHSKTTRQYECYKCGQRFVQACSIRTHLRVVHDQGDSRICDICAKFFKCSQSYNLHYKLSHTNEVTKVQCNICKIWLKHEYMLRNHMRVHKQGEVQICKYCGKESPHIRALRSHILRNHTDITKFPCHICSKFCKNSTKLKEHIALHTGDNSLYNCSFCSRTFRTNANMYAHRKRAHPIEYQNSKLFGLNYKNNTT